MEHINERPQSTDTAGNSRRAFLRTATAAAVTGGLLTGCSTSDLQVTPVGARAAAAGDVIVLPGGDVGILNYAFVIEQLESRFYELVLANPSPSFTAMELQLLQDLRNHEVTHRAFYRAALGPAGIPNLTFDFSSINVRDRYTVLLMSKMFAETGTAAYNGGGKYLSNPTNIALAGKIVSVEARHVSVIREMLYPNQTAFAGEDIVDGQGLFIKYEPSQVLPMVQKYIVETIDARNLPSVAA